MSDARNSSNNLRGGGAKQSGGSGRTTKGAYSQKDGATIGVLGEVKNDRSDAKRNLQLQLLAKQLAGSVRKAILESHTEAEYEKFDIPLPDPASATKKLKAMKEFTEDWYDKDFRHEWLLKVTEVWKEELRKEYQEAFAAERAAKGDTVGASDFDCPFAEREASIEALEILLQCPDITPEQRKRLKNKLKKKKQKAKKKSHQADANTTENLPK
mmetsp:Transcript_34990/g.68891  ORF Transcript_34990/g.68891 Transcript_34990/m.68891 type:complete len:213 (+) Transcript_34990:57-695(+)